MPPGPNDVDRLVSGTDVVLFVGELDPPTMDHHRALEALFASGAKLIWLCPIGEDVESKRAMAQIACAEYCVAAGRPVGCCSVALDKKASSPAQAIKVCRNLFPHLKFSLAMLASEDPGDRIPDIVIGFRGQDVKVKAKRILPVRKFRSCPAGIRKRIAAGRDESRNLQPSVWKFVQENRLYR